MVLALLSSKTKTTLSRSSWRQSKIVVTLEESISVSTSLHLSSMMLRQTNIISPRRRAKTIVLWHLTNFLMSTKTWLTSTPLSRLRTHLTKTTSHLTSRWLSAWVARSRSLEMISLLLTRSALEQVLIRSSATPFCWRWIRSAQYLSLSKHLICLRLRAGVSWCPTGREKLKTAL